jgi:hypothetical protein
VPNVCSPLETWTLDVTVDVALVDWLAVLAFVVENFPLATKGMLKPRVSETL